MCVCRENQEQEEGTGKGEGRWGLTSDRGGPTLSCDSELGQGCRKEEWVIK